MNDTMNLVTVQKQRPTRAGQMQKSGRSAAMPCGLLPSFLAPLAPKTSSLDISGPFGVFRHRGGGRCFGLLRQKLARHRQKIIDRAAHEVSLVVIIADDHAVPGNDIQIHRARAVFIGQLQATEPVLKFFEVGLERVTRERRRDEHGAIQKVGLRKAMQGPGGHEA